MLLADGRRAFVKSMDGVANPHSVRLHRTEARVMSALPTSVPAPALLAVIDEDGWFTVVLEAVAGSHPTPSAAHTTAVLDALATMPLATGALRDLDRADVLFAEQEHGAWERMFASEALPQDAFSTANLDRLRAAADGVVAAVAGEHLVHLDCRSDNVLVDADGAATLVDWPWAAVGCSWLDGVAYLLDARMHGARDAEAHLATHPLFAGTDPEAVDAVLAGLAGSFFERAAAPEPPGLTGLRAFQRREAETAIDWLAERWA